MCCAQCPHEVGSCARSASTPQRPARGDMCRAQRPARGEAARGGSVCRTQLPREGEGRARRPSIGEGRALRRRVLRAYPREAGGCVRGEGTRTTFTWRDICRVQRPLRGGGPHAGAASAAHGTLEHGGKVAELAMGECPRARELTVRRTWAPALLALVWLAAVAQAVLRIVSCPRHRGARAHSSAWGDACRARRPLRGGGRTRWRRVPRAVPTRRGGAARGAKAIAQRPARGEVCRAQRP